MASMYEQGLSVPKDPAEAVKWYRKAAEAGNPTGMCALGKLYEAGSFGLKRDPVEAIKWYRGAIEAAKGIDVSGTEAKLCLKELMAASRPASNPVSLPRTPSE